MFPEYTGSYLIALQKPSGGIRGIAPVDIWRRATGNAIVQVTQKIAAKTCIETYPNFKQLTLSKDGASHCLYFLNAAYSDPDFTSAEDAEDPWVIMQLDIKNAFGSLCARLVLDVLSGKASRDYSCGIKVDEDFETAVHELRAYFGFFKLAHVNLSSVFIPRMGPRITSNSKRGVFKVTAQNSWYFALSPFTSGAASSRCSLNFEAWLTLTMKPQLGDFLKL